MMKRISSLLLVALLINYVNSSAETTNQGSALPTIQICTLSGVLPSAEVVDAPENCWGSSIVNNEYEECVVEFINPGHENIVSKGRIRVRGNTSTTGTEKKSYKIKFDDSIDLSDRGDYNYDDKNWALLNNGDKLSTLIGSWVAKYCGVEYVPEVMLVNVVINEDWRGLYYLSEMVNRSQQRMNISDNGFIVENNAYWWKEDHYFKIPVFWYYPYKILVHIQKPVPFVTVEEFKQIQESPCIIYFLGEDRPWREGNTHRYSEDYLKYLSMTPWKNTPLEEG